MSPITLLLALLFTSATMLAIATLARSYRNAFAAYRQLRRALAACEDHSAISWKVSGPVRAQPAVLRPAIRHTQMNKRIPVRTRQPELRAAA